MTNLLITTLCVLLSLFALHFRTIFATSSPGSSSNFTVVNGQIFTPGLAIIDAPQPFTPLGGDFLQVAIEVSGNGKLAWPPPVNGSNIPTQFHNITIFLTSYLLGHNYTISNATNSTGGLPFGDILQQEPSSTVKHVNWEWPLCLVSDNRPSSEINARGAYNISIHQSFRLNGSDYYTIFDLPINVSNSIPLNTSSKQDENNPNPSPKQDNGTGRVSCKTLENDLLPYDVMMNATSVMATQPYLGGPVLVGNYGGFLGSKGGASRVQSSIGMSVVFIVMWIALYL